MVGAWERGDGGGGLVEVEVEEEGVFEYKGIWYGW